MDTIPQIEEDLARMRTRSDWETICQRYNTLLAVLGDVSGEEGIALVLLAEWQVFRNT